MEESIVQEPIVQESNVAEQGLKQGGVNLIGNKNQIDAGAETKDMFKSDNEAAKNDNEGLYTQAQLMLALSKLRDKENPDQELIKRLETIIREEFARGGIIGFQRGKDVKGEKKEEEIEFDTTPIVGSDNYDTAVRLLQQAGTLDKEGNLLTRPDMTSPEQARKDALKNLLEGERKTLGETQKKELQEFYGQVSPEQLKKEQDSAFLRNIGGGTLGLRDASTARAKVKDAQRKEQERQILGLQALDRDTLKDRIDVRKSAEEVFKSSQANMKDLMTTSINTLATMSAEDRKAAEAIIDRDFNLLKLNVEAALERARIDVSSDIENKKIVADLSKAIATVTASLDESYAELDLLVGNDEAARARNKKRKERVSALLIVPMIELMAKMGGDVSMYKKPDSDGTGEDKTINVGDLSKQIADLLGS